MSKDAIANYVNVNALRSALDQLLKEKQIYLGMLSGEGVMIEGIEGFSIKRGSCSIFISIKYGKHTIHSFEPLNHSNSGRELTETKQFDRGFEGLRWRRGWGALCIAGKCKPS